MRTYSPRVRMTVEPGSVLYPKDAPRVLDLSDHLITLSTSKRYGHAAGGWQCTLPYRTVYNGLRYDQLLTANDLVTIDIDAGDGKGFSRVMVGLVSRVARTYTVAPDGTPHRAISLAGLDLGKLLMTHDCGYGIEAGILNERGTSEIEPVELMRLGRGLRFTGTPAKLISSMLDALFFQDVEKWASYYDLEITTDDTWETSNYTVLFTTGPVWTALKQCEDHPWNVLTTDTVDDLNKQQLQILLEKYPVNDDGYLARTRLNITSEEIIAEDLGVSDDERVTFLWYKPHLTIVGQDDAAPIYFGIDGLVQYNDVDIRRHGFVKQIIETNFARIKTTLAEPPPADFIAEAAARGKALWERVRYNHELESGTMALHISPRIRAGSAIYHETEGKEYLAEMVEHTCVFGERPVFTTRLHLTRGQEA